MKRFCAILIALLICLVGCSNEKSPVSKEVDSKSLVDRLVLEGVPQNSIKVTEKYLWDEIYINDRDKGRANINVYKNVSDAQKYWDKLEERYNDLRYLDDNTAAGYLKDVCDAQIEEWIYFDRNVIVSVEQYIGNEWATYIGDDGEEYYGDGTKVSDVASYDEQKAKATKFENKIMNCLK